MTIYELYRLLMDYFFAVFISFRNIFNLLKHSHRRKSSQYFHVLEVANSKEFIASQCHMVTQMTKYFYLFPIRLLPNNFGAVVLRPENRIVLMVTISQIAETLLQDVCHQLISHGGAYENWNLVILHASSTEIDENDARVILLTRAYLLAQDCPLLMNYTSQQIIVKLRKFFCFSIATRGHAYKVSNASAESQDNCE